MQKNVTLAETIDMYLKQSFLMLPHLYHKIATKQLLFISTMSQFCETNVTMQKKVTIPETLDMYLKQSYDFVIEISSFIISAVSQFHHEIVSDIHTHTN